MGEAIGIILVIAVIALVIFKSSKKGKVAHSKYKDDEVCGTGVCDNFNEDDEAKKDDEEKNEE